MRNTPARGLHIGIIRAPSAFRRNPGDVLVGVLDVAGFAVNAVLRVDDIFHVRAFPDPFIDAGGAIARRRAAINIVLGGFLQRRIGNEATVEFDAPDPVATLTIVGELSAR